MEIKNSEKQIELRRYQNILRIVGQGVILFGLWSVVKTLIIVFFTREQMIDYVIEESSKELQLQVETTRTEALAVLIIMLSIVLIVDLVFRLVVGMSAMSEGRGKKRGYLYVILTFFLISSSFTTLLTGSLQLILGTDTSNVTQELLNERPSILSLTIELTSLIMLIEMVFSAVRVKSLRKELEAEAGSEAADKGGA